MNIIEKIKSAGLSQGLTFNISGDRKTRLFYGEITNPYKILSLASGSNKTFDSLCSYLIQNKKDCQFYANGCDYDATFIEEEFKVVIKKRINGYQYISFYKKNK